MTTHVSEEARRYTQMLLEMVGDRDPLVVMAETPPALRQLVAGLPAHVLARPEAPGKWSIAHVMHHLADSELVGAYRFRMVLAHDTPSIQGYDQNLWVERLHEPPGEVAEALDSFGFLRRANLRLLSGLTAADRRRAGMHAERGEESLDHMLRLYAAHDLVHLRQLARIRDAVA